ncbi:hypothetical protein QJS66_08900 [Kocuria rhizophila]|nr:hypothetical protein QJS66_08900 [Kocuria rhizophila]
MMNVGLHLELPGHDPGHVRLRGAAGSGRAPGTLFFWAWIALGALRGAVPGPDLPRPHPRQFAAAP